MITQYKKITEVVVLSIRNHISHIFYLNETFSQLFIVSSLKQLKLRGSITSSNGTTYQLL